MNPRILRYSISFLLVLTGLIANTCLGHLLSWWLFVQITSVFLPAVGISILLGTQLFRERGQRAKTSDRLSSTIKKLAFIVLLFAGISYLGKLGGYLNYQIRDYFLSQHTETTNGFIIGVAEKKLSRGASSDFYLVEFSVDGDKHSYGLLVEYQKMDEGIDENYSLRSFDGNTLMVSRPKLMRVKVQYSTAHPSFFRVQL